MLRPRDTATRERRSLNGLWRFALDPPGRADRRGGSTGRCRDAGDGGAGQLQRHRCPTPTVARPLRRRLVPDAPSGCRAAGTAGAIVLYFESATHRATVWVDGTEVVSHEGGYTPFEADVTAHIRPGDEARVTVVVNNTLTFQTHPAGGHRGHAGRQAAALLPRLLQLRRPPPPGLAVQHAARTSTDVTWSPGSTVRAAP